MGEANFEHESNCLTRLISVIMLAKHYCTGLLSSPSNIDLEPCFSASFSEESLFDLFQISSDDYSEKSQDDPSFYSHLLDIA